MGAKRPVNRSTATKLTRTAQAAALLLAIGTGAVIALDFRTGEGVEPADPVSFEPVDVSIPQRDTEPLIPDVREIDFGGLVERISQVDNAPEPPVVEGPPDDGPGETTDDPGTGDPGIADRIAYLGHIRVGDALMALLRVDGTQRTARPGAVIPGSVGDGRSALELVRVRHGDVLVRAAGSSGSSTIIQRADGGGAAPSENTIAAVQRPAGVAPSQEERVARARAREGDRGNGAVLEPDPLKRRLDSIKRLYDQGRIDEERYKTMTQRAQEQLERAQQARESQDDE